MDTFGKNIPFYQTTRIYLTGPSTPWWDRLTGMDEPWGDATQAATRSLTKRLARNMETVTSWFDRCRARLH